MEGGNFGSKCEVTEPSGKFVEYSCVKVHEPSKHADLERCMGSAEAWL